MTDNFVVLKNMQFHEIISEIVSFFSLFVAFFSRLCRKLVLSFFVFSVKRRYEIERPIATIDLTSITFGLRHVIFVLK